jgi:hypothetical protein
MAFVKRITVGFIGFAIAGILTVGCEPFDGTAPDLNQRLVHNQLLLISAPDSSGQGGGQVIGAPISLDTLKKIVVDDAAIQAIINDTTCVALPMASLRKIIFQ